MAWIELHQTLPRHPKLARLANRLRITRAQAAGHLTFLWLWALDYSPTGDLSALEPAEISAAAEFGGDPELFASALKQSGWVDGDGKIHDWMEYAGRLMEQRAYQSGKKREMTKAYKSGVIDAVRNRDGNKCRYCSAQVDWWDKKGPSGATYDHVVPGFEATLENLVVSCRSCNSKKGQRTPKEAGMRLLEVSRSVPETSSSNLATVPNRTQPNPTQQNQPKTPIPTCPPPSNPEASATASLIQKDPSAVSVSPEATKTPEGGKAAQFEAFRNRVGLLLRRRASTAWSDKELKALASVAKLQTPEEDIALLEKRYASNDPYLRKDILTLLNNWGGEIDRARAAGNRGAGPDSLRDAALRNPRNQGIAGFEQWHAEFQAGASNAESNPFALDEQVPSVAQESPDAGRIGTPADGETGPNR